MFHNPWFSVAFLSWEEEDETAALAFETIFKEIIIVES